MDLPPVAAPATQPAPQSAPQPAPELKHSGFGITSFVMSIVCGFLTFVVFGVAGYLETTTPGGMSEESPAAVGLGLLIFGLGFLVLLALGFGVGGLFQKNRKKTFAVIGVAVNLLILLGTGGLIVLGLTMG